MSKNASDDVNAQKLISNLFCLPISLFYTKTVSIDGSEGVLHGGSVPWGYLILDKLPHSSGAAVLLKFLGYQKG